MENTFKSFTSVKAKIPHYKNTLLQGEILHSKFYADVKAHQQQNVLKIFQGYISSVV